MTRDGEGGYITYGGGSGVCGGANEDLVVLWLCSFHSKEGSVSMELWLVCGSSCSGSSCNSGDRQ